MSCEIQQNIATEPEDDTSPLVTIATMTVRLNEIEIKTPSGNVIMCCSLEELFWKLVHIEP